MAITLSFRSGLGYSDQRENPGNLHVPMVYEQVSTEPVKWEYHVLTVDPREGDLPESVQLNELGTQGWLLVGVVDQGKTGRSSLLLYYFVRQRSE